MGVLQHLLKYIECGIARFGVMRFRCPKCGEDLFVAFSCKRRGFCPHCDAKRATIIMADAADRLLPEVGYRQYVLTIPKRLRWYVNQNAALPGEISRILAREIELYLSKKTAGTAAAQLHFIQRAGRSLNLHPHVHAVVSEGRFSSEPGLLGPKLGFHPATEPTQRDIEFMTESLRRKIFRRLRRLSAIPEGMAQEMLAWPNSGFSLHAKVFVLAGDRESLERAAVLLRAARAFAYALVVPAQGNQVIYRTEPKNGSTWPAVRAGGVPSALGSVDPAGAKESSALLRGFGAELASAGLAGEGGEPGHGQGASAKEGKDRQRSVIARGLGRRA